MEKLSTTSKFVSAGAILVLGMGISAAVMTSSANATESHALPKIAHISTSGSVIPPAVIPSSIKAPSISGIASGDDSEGSSLGESATDDSTEGSSASTGASIGTAPSALIGTAPSALIGTAPSALIGTAPSASIGGSEDGSEGGSDN